MLKLRVKLMTYFIFVMKQPDRPETEETKVFFSLPILIVIVMSFDYE